MTTENNFTEASLDNFSWDDLNINMEDLVGNPEPNIEEPTNEPQPNQPSEIEPTKEQKEQEENLEEVDLNKTEETKKEEQVNETSIYDDVYKDLKEYGVLKHVNIEDNESLTPERLKELYEQDYESEVSQRLKNFADNELGDEGKNLIRFIQSGGRVSDFVSLYKDTEIPEGNIEDESFQNDLIRYQLKKEEYDHDEIEDFIENLTNSGKKAIRAKRIFERLSAEKERQREKAIFEQEEAKKARIRENNAYRETIKSTLNENKEINGFKINDKEKSELYNFITNPNVPSGESYTTGIMDKLNKVFKEPSKLVLLAKILKSDFDFKDFKKKVETETTNKVKSNLENRKGLVKSSVGSSTDRINLAEIFS